MDVDVFLSLAIYILFALFILNCFYIFYTYWKVNPVDKFAQTMKNTRSHIHMTSLLPSPDEAASAGFNIIIPSVKSDTAPYFYTYNTPVQLPWYGDRSLVNHLQLLKISEIG